jgi:hypothetical protein
MARKRASSGDSSSPNKALVVFLVLFILISMGLGGWVYSIFGERRKYEEDARKAKADVTLAKEAEGWWKLQALELRAMLGDPILRDDKTDEHKDWRLLREEFVEGASKMKDGSKYKDMKEKDAIKKWIETAVADLRWNSTGYAYATNYRAEKDMWRKEAEKYRSDAAAQMLKLKEAEEKNRVRDSVAAEFRKQDLAEIRDHAAKATKMVKSNTDTMEEAIKQNKVLREKMIEDAKKAEEEKAVMVAEIKDLKRKLVVLGDAPQKGPAKGPVVVEVQPHALALDISKGKPLWDRPRGKILRIDEQDRRVYIDKGAEDGVTVGLSFNVFAAGWDNRAEGPFKGTIEITRVEPRTSVARITSLFDNQGNEISLNDPSPNKVLREGSNAIKENDLVFNLAWGTHVAVAGVVDWSGRRVEAAAAQMEELDEFLKVLRSQGVTVDAFIDLRDGQVHGAFTSRTAYLVRGFNVVGAKGPEAERAKVVNGEIERLKKAAIDRGLFLISPENLVNVIGYRRPRSKTDMELAGFRPGMPAGGSVLVGAVAGGEGGKADDRILADLAGKWGGKISTGGVLRLSFKSDGGCVWQVTTGADKVTGYAPLVQSGKEYTIAIQGRPATVRLINAGQALQVTGQNLDATLTRE